MSFADRLKNLFRIGTANDGLFEDLADLLIEGDLGASLASAISGELKESCKVKRLTDIDSVRRELKSILSSYGKAVNIAPQPGKLSIFLVLGVNGVGKTTTCAKLADYFRRAGLASGIILAAGDTFRAAAIDQIKIHGERLGMRPACGALLILAGIALTELMPLPHVAAAHEA